jgi:protein arginine N-methyltransferase 1
MHTVEQGDKLTGELTCAPNAKNPRDLDIVIDYKVASKTGGGERREYRMA